MSEDENEHLPGPFRSLGSGRRSVSDSDSSSGSEIIGGTRKRKLTRPRHIVDSSSDSDGSWIGTTSRKRALRVLSEEESDSSGSEIIGRRPIKKVQRVVHETSDDERSTPERRSKGPATRTKSTNAHFSSDSSVCESEQCPICLQAVRKQELGTPESCEHVFCLKCIQEWSKNNNTCPVDRKKYTSILVRKHIGGKVIRFMPVADVDPNFEEFEEDITFCELCYGTHDEDRMLLCDGCDRGFHLQCLNPPLPTVPAGNWFCSRCISRYNDTFFRLHDFRSQLEGSSGSSSEARDTPNNSEWIPEDSSLSTSIQINAVVSVPSTSTGQTRRQRRRRERRTRQRVTNLSNNTIRIKKKSKKRRKRRSTRRERREQETHSVKQRLAHQLGIQPPSTQYQCLPEVHRNIMNVERLVSNLPGLDLFGQRDTLDYYSSAEEDNGGVGVFTRRMPNSSDTAAFRRTARRKALLFTSPAITSNLPDILGNILEAQAAFHSKESTFSVGNNGKLNIINSKSQDINLNDFNRLLKQKPAPYGDGHSYSSNNMGSNISDDNYQNSSNPNYYSNASGQVSVGVTSSTTNNFQENVEDYSQTTLSTYDDGELYDPTLEYEKEEIKNLGNNHSDSEIDIYSDIETVSTSKMEDDSKKPYSPSTVMPDLDSVPSPDCDNDSDTDMVIDTETNEIYASADHNVKEDAAVTSSEDSVAQFISTLSDQPAAHSTFNLHSEEIQSTHELFDKESTANDEEDNFSEDGCPNFSTYSRETIDIAKNTEISLNSEGNVHEDNQVEEVSSTPQKCEEQLESNEPRITQSDELGYVFENISNRRVPGMEEQQSTLSNFDALYSDSEDEAVVKKVADPFALSDIRNLTEDISEEERSYTPCLDENRPNRKEFDELDTELISDEEKNDFEESHELKTISDMDALEINAKESEMDFTRPDDFEEGEIVDRTKPKESEQNKVVEKRAGTPKIVHKRTENIRDFEINKENQIQNRETFKRLSKNNRERNYREKDRSRSNEHVRNQKDMRKERRKSKRQEIERYDVRALIAEKPRRLKDKFGRDIRKSSSLSRSGSPSPKRSISKGRKANSKKRSPSREQRSWSAERPKRKRVRMRKSRSESPFDIRERLNSRRRSSAGRGQVRKKNKTKDKTRKKSGGRRETLSPRMMRVWPRFAREWTPNLSRSPEPIRHLSPSWTPPRLLEQPEINPHNFRVILPNETNKKRKEKRRKSDKRNKDGTEKRKRRRGERPPNASKEVFASGDNILVSVSFNKEVENREKRRKEVEEAIKRRKERERKALRRIQRNEAISGIKPVAIIDLERSPFKELTPSPKDIIVLSDEEQIEITDPRNLQEPICTVSEQVASPEPMSMYSMGPKTPPEPQIKFSLNKQQPALRAISNPLHDPDDIDVGDDQEQLSMDDLHIGPNTPPEPPSSPPSSPDAYDPFEPTKSRSPTPEPTKIPGLEDDHQENVKDVRSITNDLLDLSNTKLSHKASLQTPPADIQPADSQSSLRGSPHSDTVKSPDHLSLGMNPPAPFPVATSIVTSTPVSSNLPSSRINILSSTVLTNAVQPNAQRMPSTKVSPAKISPTKANTKSTPTKQTSWKSSKVSKKLNTSQNGNEETILNLDSPYSPGSSDYEDLFEPPETKTAKSKSKVAPKVQNAFDSLFGSPFNKIKMMNEKSKTSKKQSTPSKSKGIKYIGVKYDEDHLKILDELPNSAVEMQVKDKFLKKLNRQERVVEEVKLVLKPYYNKKRITKDEYKDIMRRAVPKICHNKSGEINPTKIKNLIEAYVKKVKHSKKVTSSSSVSQKL